MSYTIPCKRELTQEMGVIYMALDAVTRFMAKWLDDNLKTLSSDYWDRYVVSSLYESQRKTLADNGAKSLFDLDQPTILSVFLQNKQVLISKLGVDQQLFGYAHSIKDIRNKYFHKNSKPLAVNRYKHDLGTMRLFLEGLGAPPEVVSEVNEPNDRAETSVQKQDINEAQGKDAANEIAASQIKTSLSTALHGEAATGTGQQPAVNTSDGKSISMTKRHDTKRYPQKISDRLRARGIAGYEISVVDGEEATSLFKKADAGKFGYNLEVLDFAILASRSSAAILSLSEVKEILDRGFCKQLPKAVELDCENCLAWFFGSVNSKEHESSDIKFVSPPINAEAAIPAWFERAIGKNDLPYLSVEEVQVTLQLDECGVERYAKTYSPRTFVEGVAMGKGVPPEFLARIANEGVMKIVDVGCGTGALSQGVLHGLDRKLRKPCVPHLTLIDGNVKMLEKARTFLASREDSRTFSIPRIEYDVIEKVMSSAGDCFGDTDYDMIVTSKFLGELVCKGVEDVYRIFIKEAMGHLRKGGIVVLVDIPKHQVVLSNAVKALFHGNIPVKSWEVRPAYIGENSNDIETVVSVMISK